MVEADSHLKLFIAPIWDIYKVFEHIDMLSINVWLKPYTVITTQLGSDVGVLDVGVYMQAMIYIYGTVR